MPWFLKESTERNFHRTKNPSLSGVWVLLLKTAVSLACNSGVLFWASSTTTILDFISRGRLGRVEIVTKGVGIS